MAGHVRILVAYDGSDCARAAIKSIPLFSKLIEVELMVLWVVEPPSWLYSESLSAELNVNIRNTFVGKAKESLAALEDDLRGLVGLSYERITFGNPAERIVFEAKLWEADLLIMGRQGVGAFGYLHSGSTVKSVVDNAPCPVMVISKPLKAPLNILMAAFDTDFSAPLLDTIRCLGLLKEGRMRFEISTESLLSLEAIPLEFQEELSSFITEWSERRLEVGLSLLKGLFQDGNIEGRSYSGSGSFLQQICIVAESWQADMVLLSGVISKSTSDYRIGGLCHGLLQATNINVLIIPN